MARGGCGTKAPLPPRAQPKSHFEFVPRDTEESEFLDVVDFRGVAFSVETVILVAVLHEQRSSSDMRPVQQ